MSTDNSHLPLTAAEHDMLSLWTHGTPWIRDVAADMPLIYALMERGFLRPATDTIPDASPSALRITPTGCKAFVRYFRPGTLWLTRPAGRGQHLVKISTSYFDAPSPHLTAEQVIPLPPRTTVRSYYLENLRQFQVPSDRLVREYEHAWGLTPSASEGTR